VHRSGLTVITYAHRYDRCAAKKAIGLLYLLIWFVVMGIVWAHAQDKGTLNPEPLPPLPNPDAPTIPARELFARKMTPPPGLRDRLAHMPTVALKALTRCQSTDQLGR
jgi:hypothetical protein